MLFSQTDPSWGLIAVIVTGVSGLTAAITAALVKLMPEWRLNKQLEQQIRQSSSDQITAGFKELLKASEEDRKAKETKLDEVSEELRKVMQAEARCHERADWLEKRVKALEERERVRQEAEEQRKRRRQRPPGSHTELNGDVGEESPDDLPAVRLNGAGCEEDNGYGE